MSRRRTRQKVLEELVAVNTEIGKLSGFYERQNRLFAEGKAMGITFAEMAKLCGISAEAVRQGAARASSVR